MFLNKKEVYRKEKDLFLLYIILFHLFQRFSFNTIYNYTACMHVDHFVTFYC